MFCSSFKSSPSMSPVSVMIDEQVLAAQSKRATCIDVTSHFCSNNEYTVRSQRKVVRFSYPDEIIQIPHFRDLTEEEKRRVWLTGKDLHKIRKENLELVTTRQQQRGKISSTKQEREHRKEDCMRGLEIYSPTVAKQRKFFKKLAWETVFEEQKFQNSKQQCSTILNDDILAYSYANACIIPMHAALYRGRRDERRAIEIMSLRSETKENKENVSSTQVKTPPRLSKRLRLPSPRSFWKQS